MNTQLVLRVLKRVEYWFDIDEEVAEDLTPDELADNNRMLSMVRTAIKEMEQSK